MPQWEAARSCGSGGNLFYLWDLESCTKASEVWWKWNSLSCVPLFATPWTTQSMEFSRPEYWSELPFPSSGEPLDPGIKLGSPALQSLYQLSYEGSPKRKWKWLSPVWLFATHSPWNSPGQNIGVSSLSLLQGIFSTQGSNPDLPHCRQILHQLSHKGNPCKCNIVINEQSCVFIIKSLSISVF